MAVRPRQMPERLSGPLERAHARARSTRLELAALTAAEARELLGAAGDAATAVRRERRQPVLPAAARASPRAHGGGAADASLAGVEVPRRVVAALAEELAALASRAPRARGRRGRGRPVRARAGRGRGRAWPSSGARRARRAAGARSRAPHRRAAPLPLPPPARAQRRLRGRARRLAARARTSAAPRRSPRAALRPRRARTTSSTPRGTGDAEAIAVLREAGEAASPRAPAPAPRAGSRAALRLLPAATAPEERIELLAALAGGAHGGRPVQRGARGAAGVRSRWLPPRGERPRVQLDRRLRADREPDRPPRRRAGAAEAALERLRTRLARRPSR